MVQDDSVVDWPDERGLKRFEPECDLLKWQLS